MKEKYFDGIELDVYIQKNELDLQKFLYIAIELCKVIESFHKQNITIRTLSSSSILIDAENGLSVMIRNDDKENLNEKDRIYRAPEQNERISLTVENSVDIYSLGVVFYEIFSEKIEHDNKSSQDFFYELFTQELPPLHQLDASIPVTISNIIEKMTAKNRHERYNDILSVHVDLAKSLKQFQENGTIGIFKLDTFKPYFKFNKSELIYGREVPEEEIEKIINAKESLNTLIAVSGNSGVGKSFFMTKVLEKNKQHFSDILELKLERYKQNAPYEILYDALRNFTKQILSQDENIVQNYRKELRNLLGNEAQILIDVIPEIEAIIGKQPQIKDIHPVDKKARFDSMLFHFMELFFHSQKPFCIYIDDLQWADDVIIQWLQNILIKFKNLFVFITYRNEEVQEGHEIRQMFERVYFYDVKIKEIQLRGLEKEDIKNLLYNTMQLEKAEEIAEIIVHKTDGNAFFVNQYIKQLQENDTIYFSHDTLEWYCDLQKLQQMPISDNVFEVLSRRIDLLEKHVRTLLNIASCLGSSFTHTALQRVYADEVLFESALEAAMKDEWIILYSKGGQRRYSFSHDKMQEALYSKLDDETLSQIHYKIGKNLLQNEQKLENKKLISCVNHLNIGYKLLYDITLLIELNVKASLHSKKSGDFTNALLYIKKAMEFMEAESLNITDVSILKDRAECEHLCHNSDEAVHYYEKALQLSDSKIQKAQIYELLIKFYSDISDFQKAYETGCEATKLFGFNMPKSFFPPQFIFDFIRLRVKLKGKSIDDICEIPDANDEEFIYLVKLAANSLQAAYQIRPELCVANAVKIVTLCLQKGLTKESVIAFTVFGVIFQGGILGDHTAGFDYYRLSINMLHRFENTIQHAEVKFVSGYFATSWKQSAAMTEKLWEEAYKNGHEIGDWFHTGCAAAGIVQSMFMRGVNLNELLEKIEHYLVVLKNIGTMEQYGAVLSVKHAVLNLQGKTASPLSFNTDEFDESAYIHSLSNYTSKHFAHYYYINKLSALYMHKEYKKALDISNEGKKFASDSKGMLHNTEHIFYEALTVAKLYEYETLSTQMKYKKIVQKAKKSFYKWSKGTVENFMARAYLLEGELYRLQGDTNRAIEFYEKALSTATIYMQTNIIALANKLTQEIYEELGQKKAAEIYEKTFLETLVEWGVIEKQREEVVAKFDIETLMKASEIIVKEQRLSNLLQALVKTIIQNSGAQNIFLLLQEEEELFIEAHYSIDSDKTEVMQHQPYIESKKIVQPVINYVLRTQKSIVIDDLNESKIFYDKKNMHKEVKSLLCAPLILKGKIKGVIYLENNLLPGVFTDDKVKLLQYLSGQIAISIENAVVYNNLEKAVALRTKELEHANKKLEKLSTLDPLTKISNRRHFETHMQDIWSLAIRKEVPTSIVMCDIDYFKKINDTYGHIIGDYVLKNVASIIQNSLKRTTDFAARYGGEEFIIALYDTDLEGAKKISQSIADTLKSDEKNFVIDGVNIEPFTISFGVSSLIPQQEDNYEQLIKSADEALYEAKRNGRNCIVSSSV
ncbi:diguanylate cyclase [Sulfurimonas marina]|uniref:Diguanylate cyclase n=1 Tax=Sulfurimonas marina TaxID=2590551 RepID=A0A7M1AUF7_9BACT|nr:diguanylate cyclase [Sulfurimonas marina]QOP41061.1 diguanylate cyclase [Sulfurimonas marina]